MIAIAIAIVPPISSMGVRARVVGVGPALAELTPLHLLVVNQLFIDRMAIELRDRLSISSWGNEARIARAIPWISSVAAISVAAISVVTAVVAGASTGSLVSTLVSTIWRTCGSR